MKNEGGGQDDDSTHVLLEQLVDLVPHPALEGRVTHKLLDDSWRHAVPRNTGEWGCQEGMAQGPLGCQAPGWVHVEEPAQEIICLILELLRRSGQLLQRFLKRGVYRVRLRYIRLTTSCTKSPVGMKPSLHGSIPTHWFTAVRRVQQRAEILVQPHDHSQFNSVLSWQASMVPLYQ